MFDPIRIGMVGGGLAQTTHKPGPLLHFTQEDATTVGSDITLVEATYDITPV